MFILNQGITMAFTLNGIPLPIGSSSIFVDGQSIDTLIENGFVVWSKYEGGDSPLIITESTTLTAGVDFPISVPVRICMCGGGGGGQLAHIGQAFGGQAGEEVSQEVFMPPGEIEVVIGTGGPIRIIPGLGYNGTETMFGSLIAYGGRGGAQEASQYPGVGGTRESCSDIITHDGSAYAGSVYGGQAGVFGNGSNGSYFIGTTAGIGGGGGAVSNYAPGAASGAGGRGQVKLSWEL